MLTKLLSKLPAQAANPSLLVGYETGDDAAVYKINGEQGVIATTDFFMPIVDDPFDYGRIAAANALSDVYAIGGKPIMALAIAGFPMDKMTVGQVQNILAGGNQVCADAGVPIAGGHTIDAPEPIYGLAVVGLVHPDKIKRNNAAKDGDVLILGKGLGVGILGAALNNDQLDNIGYGELIKSAVKLNSIGNELSEIPGVHAVTDVTGFGLVGHLLEVCSGSNLSATLYWDQLPILPSAINYAQRGLSTGAGNRNWDSFGDDVTLTNVLEEWQKNLITDPQTSGGLLVSCLPNQADKILSLFHEQKYEYAAIIGNLEKGVPHINVK